MITSGEFSLPDEFLHSAQKAIAEKSLAETDASDLWKDPIITEISPLSNYSEAEDYHQNYFNDNPRQGYCRFVVGPKVAKFKKVFKDKVKKDER